MKNDRASIRGKHLDDDCKKAKISRHEYGMDDNRCFCYGLIDMSTEALLPKCIECGAYCLNAKPLSNKNLER